MAFRTYDKAWNRTGYSEQPQYSGQADMTHDFAPNCPQCNGSIVGFKEDFVYCAKKHKWKKELISA